MGKKYLICLLLLVATIITFWQMHNYEFVNIDDRLYVVNNPQVQAGITSESVAWAFTSYYAGVWMPLTWLSYMLDFELYGLSPGGYHLTNVFFHLANTLLLFLVLKKMTEEVWQSAFVAALFALHPLHVESVAWIAERKDVLSTFFWMLTMWAYLLYVKRPGSARYLLIVIAFALGLMAKPMLVTLPFVLLLLDYWPLERLESGRSLLRLLLEKTPLFVLSAIFCFVTLIVQRKGGASAPFDDFPLSVTVPNALVSYVRYLSKMIWPQKLAVFYPHPGSSLPMWQAVAAGLLLVSISVVVLCSARRRSYLAMGWLWYLGTLVPVIGLVQTGNHSMADRFTYLPLIGLFIIVAWGVPDLLAKWRYRQAIITVATGLLLATLITVTRAQLRHWNNSVTLFQHTLKVTSKSTIAHNGLGVALFEQGKIREAIFHYNKALELKPNSAKIHSNLGNALAKQGKLREAIFHHNKAMELDPNSPKIRGNLGVALARQGRLDEAIIQFEKALGLKPDYAETHNNLANALALQGNLDDAIFHYSRALEISDDYPEAHDKLGAALANKGKVTEAIVHYQAALRTVPDSAQTHNNLGVAFFTMGQLNKAISHYRTAIRLDPNFSKAHNNLGNALARKGMLDEAISQYSKALELKTNYPEAHNNLGVALAQQGKMDEAVIQFEEALRLKPDYAQARTNLAYALDLVKDGGDGSSVNSTP